MATIAISGIQAIQKALEQLDGKDRQNTLRRAVRAATKPFIAEMKAVASAADVPRSFQKIPAAKVSTQRGASGREVGATVRPKSPLFNILEPGAKRHDMSGDFLFGQVGSSGWDPQGRKRGDTFAAHGTVHHPGLASRDIIGPSFAGAQAAASKALADVILGQAGSGE